MERPKTSKRRNLRNSTRETSIVHGGGEISSPAQVSNSAVYRFCQFVATRTISQNGAGEGLYGLSFKLNDMADYANYQTLFDQYRITKVDMTFHPVYRANPVSLTANPIIMPLIYTAVDYDDTTVVSIADLQQYQNCEIHDDQVTFTISLTPSTLSVVYISGISSGYAPEKGKWLDLAYPAIPHYGIKICISNGVESTYLQNWNVTTRYTVEFKNVR